jgi:hypothetical protein
LAALPASPRRAPPAPLAENAEAQAKRGYFNRGFMSGMQRLDDDAKIALWHYTGKTHTVGDPLGKASLAFHQEGGSCAIGSQLQALEVRGKIKPTSDDKAMRDLVKRAAKEGAFPEYRTKDNHLFGGTSSENVDRMLQDYHVPHELNFEATSQDLDKAVLQSGDAIVFVDAKYFWYEPKMPSGGHAVYMTGAEVDKTGKVVGYYFNDTGTGEAARYMPAKSFNKAWAHAFIAFPPNDN